VKNSSEGIDNLFSGVFTLEYTPPPREISADVIWGKYVKRAREKVGKCERKRNYGK
jgi:hypothetical protein